MMMLMPTFAAETESADSGLDANFSVDLVSQYIWRGQNSGGVSFQPGAGISWKGLSLSAWGSTGFRSKDTREVDFTLGYSWKGLTVDVTDYWFSGGPAYFHYKAHDTAHIYEAHIGYDFFGYVALDWYTNFAGNDGVGCTGRRAYSSYVQLSAPFKIKFLDWKAEVGATPWDTSFYGAHRFAVINIGLQVGHTFPIAKKFGLSVYTKGVCNPRAEQCYFVAGVGFATL